MYQIASLYIIYYIYVHMAYTKFGMVSMLSCENIGFRVCNSHTPNINWHVTSKMVRILLWLPTFVERVNQFWANLDECLWRREHLYVLVFFFFF